MLVHSLCKIPRLFSCSGHWFSGCITSQQDFTNSGAYIHLKEFNYVINCISCVSQKECWFLGYKDKTSMPWCSFAVVLSDVNFTVNLKGTITSFNWFSSSFPLLPMTISCTAQEFFLLYSREAAKLSTTNEGEAGGCLLTSVKISGQTR